MCSCNGIDIALRRRGRRLGVGDVRNTNVTTDHCSRCDAIQYTAWKNIHGQRPTCRIRKRSWIVNIEEDCTELGMSLVDATYSSAHGQGTLAKHRTRWAAGGRPIQRRHGIKGRFPLPIFWHPSTRVVETDLKSTNAFAFTKSDLRSLDFAVNRFLMKIFRSKNSEIIMRKPLRNVVDTFNSTYQVN